MARSAVVHATFKGAVLTSGLVTFIAARHHSRIFMYLWFCSVVLHDRFKSAVLTSGPVTFITACHHSRIFNSREELYSRSAGGVRDGAPDVTAPL